MGINIKKKVLLEQLQSIEPGLSPLESMEQSSCFVFYEGEIVTFNDEIACRVKTEIDIPGASPARSMLQALAKSNKNSMIARENEKRELEFVDASEQPLLRFALNRDPQVLLPVEKIREEADKLSEEDWIPLPPNFSDIIEKVKTCVCKNEEFFALTCVHFHPKWIEACDSRQVLRWRVKFGLESEFLVRGHAIAKVGASGMTHIALTDSWVHFRNEGKKLIFSCRKFVEEYPSLSEVIAVEGESLRLPKTLGHASDRADVFASEQVTGIDSLLTVSLRPGWMQIRGEGLTGWSEEKLPMREYRGSKLRFVISPALLHYISDNYEDCKINETKLKASGERWTYVSVLGKFKSKAEQAADQEARRAAQDIDSEAGEPPAKKKKKVAEEEDVAS